MSKEITLGEFAEEHGTADDIRSETTTRQRKSQQPEEGNTSNGGGDDDTAATTPTAELPITGSVGERYIHPDRHVEVSQIPRYWRDEQAEWNLIPRGEFAVIFDETTCQHGWPVGTDLQAGVYLRGNHQSSPPAPVGIRDSLLRGAATTAAQAAHKIVSESDLTDAPLVGLTKECATSLSIYLDTPVEPRQRVVYDSTNPEQSHLPATIPGTEDSPPLFHGFSHIRLFNKNTGDRDHPGHEVYIKAEEPRLSLLDIGWTQTLNNSL